MQRQNHPRDLAQAPFGAVAGHCVADLFGTGKAHANAIATGFIAPAVAALDHHALGALTTGAGSGKEIATLGDHHGLWLRQRAGGGCIRCTNGHRRRLIPAGSVAILGGLRRCHVRQNVN